MWILLNYERKIIKLFLISWVLLLVGCVNAKNENLTQLKKSLYQHIDMLTNQIGERNYKKIDNLNKTKAYIESEFSKYGLTVSLQSYNIDSQKFYNIIAEKKGSNNSNEVYIIGAHYDSLNKTVGANDNASGVAALLEISKALSQINSYYTIRFVAFANEEPPFFQSEDMGSRHYANSLYKQNEDVKLMIALETIGYYSDEVNSQRYPSGLQNNYPDKGNYLAFIANPKSRKQHKLIFNTFRQVSDFPAQELVAPTSIRGVDLSDHSSFWDKGYSAIMVTDTAYYRYPYYHKKADTLDKINFDKLAKVVYGLSATLELLIIK